MPFKIEAKTNTQGLDAVIGVLDRIDKGTIIKKAGEQSANVLKRISGKRSGRLKRSIKFKAGSPISYLEMIWYGIPYFGRRRIFIQRTIRQLIRKNIRKELRRVGL